jgi:predicted aspartyl protease
MKITHVATVLVGIGLIASLNPACAYALDPQTLFQAERAAVGGDAWRKIAAIHISGKLIAGDAPGSFTEIIDRRNGRSLLVTDTGSLHDESGFDGAIWDKQNGIVTLADLPSLVADAETQAFVNRDGWWTGADVAEMKMLAAQTEAGSSVDGVAVTPAKGSPIDVWFDRTTHLIVRLVAHTDDGELTTVYSDWRQIDGVRLPFRQVQTDSSGAVTTLELSSATVEEKLAADALARPAAEPHGSITQGASTSIPFRLTGGDTGHILLAALINGKPSNILFDSGAANYFVPEAAHRFDLVTNGGVNIGGVGTGIETGGFARVNEISLGAARLHDEAVIVGPLPYVATHPRAGVVVDGLAGFEFLSEFRTTIDYANRRLTFASFEDRTPPGGVTVPFASDGHNVYVEATVNGATGWFRLDTGDRATVSVFRTFADEHHLFQSGGVTKLLSGGVGGTLPTHEFRDETFTLAGTTFTHVPVSVSDTQVGAFASKSIAGNLGTGILSRFRLTFDYRAHTLTFLPNPHIDAPFRSDRSGLSVTQKNAREIVVLSVVAGSQAEAAGVQAKDAIVAVNGVSVPDGGLGVSDLDPLRYGTKPFDLSIRRGDRTLTVRIVPGSAD